MRWKTTHSLDDITKHLGEYIIIRYVIDLDKGKLCYKYKVVSEDEWMKFYTKQQNGQRKM